MGVKIEPKHFMFTDVVYDKTLKDIKRSTLDKTLKGLR